MIGEDRPTAAFTLSTVGLALQALGGLLLVYALSYSSAHGFYGPGMMGPWMMFGGPWMFGFFSYWFPLIAVLAGIEITLGVLGVKWMNTANLSRVRTGSVFVLVASIIAFPTMFGFMIGSLLMLIGSVLGLTWQPRTR
ncbi:MAG: hypothetical protein HY296_03570 [Thaumarchaeota archaeon]|nr:hypothetical protein [Nitrososphaerota archaeon]